MKNWFLASVICIAHFGGLHMEESQRTPEKAAPIAQQLVTIQNVLSAQGSLSLVASASGKSLPI